MRGSNETRTEHGAVINKGIDDLVQVLNSQNADKRAVARCLQNVAVMLCTLGEPGASALVRKHF